MSNEFGKAQIGKVLLSTKEDSQSMAQEFSHPTRSEMPEIPSPNSFGMEAFHELAKDGFDAIAHVCQKAWIRLFLTLGRLVGRQQLQTLSLQSCHQFRFPIIAICQSKAIHVLQQFFCTFGVMNVGRCQGTIDNH